MTVQKTNFELALDDLMEAARWLIHASADFHRGRGQSGGLDLKAVRLGLSIYEAVVNLKGAQSAPAVGDK